MPTSTHKKAMVRVAAAGASSSAIAGYLDPADIVSNLPLPLLQTNGMGLKIAWSEIQAIFFVLDFLPPEALAGPRCWGRPGLRLPGLWVRAHGRDGFYLDGVLATSLLELNRELWLSPLYGGGLCQRVFLPTASLRRLEPLTYVRTSRTRARRLAPDQFDLFGSAVSDI